MPCRPTIACTAEIVPAGAVEVEMGYAQRRSSGAPLSSVQALAKYTVVDGLQLQLGSNNLTATQDRNTAIIDGIWGGAKLVFADQTAVRPALAVSAFVGVPTRTDGAAITTTRDAYIWGYASKDIAGIHADLNVGVNVLSIDSAPSAQLVTALSLSRDIGLGIGTMLELYAFERGAPYAQHDSGVLFGFTYSIVERVMFDIGGDVALHRDTRNMTLFAGVTFIPHVRERPIKATIASR